MATPTLANSPNPHPWLVDVRPFGPPSYMKPEPEFRVFPTGEAEYYWRIAALANNGTISRHKSLTYALKRCTRLNQRRGKGARNETN